MLLDVHFNFRTDSVKKQKSVCSELFISSQVKSNCSKRGYLFRLAEGRESSFEGPHTKVFAPEMLCFALVV